MSAYRVEWPAWADWYEASASPIRGQASGYLGGGALSLPNADAGYVEWQAVTAAGTYTLTLLYVTWLGAGKIQMSIDGSSVGTLTDCYTVGQVNNNVLTATGIALTEGVHTIRVTSNGKNASSSGYATPLQWFSLERTGA